MSQFERIVILTGAGISAESGVETFRDKDGIWSKIDYRDVATAEGFERNPERVHEFYNQRRRGMASVQPNAAHFALARLEREFAGDFLLVTQNIDDLLERGGSQKLALHELRQPSRMAGRSFDRSPLSFLRCTGFHAARCGLVRRISVPHGRNLCRSGRLRPVRLDRHQRQCLPAAGFVDEARGAGAHTVELNLEPSEGRGLFAEAMHGRATELVPGFVERILAAN